MATAVVGFVRLVSVLEAGGYGTPPMRTALVILGVSGAGFAGGIATLVWDIAKRFESPSQPEVGDGNSSR
jgi:hypothetical protein